MPLYFGVFSAMEVYVIRHTKVAVGSGTCYGQSEVPLADTFLSNVEAFKKILPPAFDAVFCSPLLRCKTLADALAPGRVQLAAALMEMNFGNWESQLWNDIDQTALRAWMSDFVHQSPPNGENLTELFARVAAFLDELRFQSHERVLLVTHAGVIRCIWAYLLDVPLHNIFKIPVSYQELLVCTLAGSRSADAITRTR
jgi:alpha-ribazole phosphatase